MESIGEGGDYIVGGGGRGVLWLGKLEGCLTACACGDNAADF